MVPDFIPRFRSEFKPLLLAESSARVASFEKDFAYLQSMKRQEYLFVETGCVRQDGWSDGRATVLFDQFLRIHRGQLFSVDINADNCAYARSQVGASTTVANEDSVTFLYRLARGRRIDLLYLDSYDVDWADPHPSAAHHLSELCAAMPGLERGSLVVVDDHVDGTGRPGKSKYIVPFMEAIGARKLVEQYQIAWVMP